MTRAAFILAVLLALAAPARAGNDVGVLVTGEGSIQPQLAAHIEGWLSQHGHTLVPSPLPAEAITALIDCFALENQGCARDVIDKRARSSSMVYAHIETASTGTRDLTLTAYWFDKGHDAVAERATCERCTDQLLRSTTDELMKKLVGGAAVGHVKLKSTPAGARITIDNHPIGVTPLDWDLLPGNHTIQMDKAGLHPVSREVVVISNQTETVALDLSATDGGPGGQERSRVLPAVLLGAGGLALIGGAVLISIDQDPVPSAPPTIRNTAPTGALLVATGVVATAAGVYLMWFRSPGATSTPVAAVTSDSAYIGWLGRF